MWDDPFWGKPFGAFSEEREQRAVIGTEWENRSVPKRVQSVPRAETMFYFRRTARGALSSNDRCPNRRQAVVKMRKYAHERLVFSSYLEAPPMGKASKREENLLRGRVLAGELDVPRKSRQGFVIGGRLRTKPLASRFTTAGKNMVRDGVHISEHQTSGDGYMLTLTFPGGTNEGFQVMAFASGYIVDRVNRFLRYRVHRGVFSYVWELQKRGAPHLHYVFRVPRGTVQASFVAEVKALWYRVLCDVTEDTRVDMFERKEGGTWLAKPEVLQVDMRPIAESYSKYLSKYLSKTASKSGAQNKWCPGRWWGVSAPCRKLIHAARLEVIFPVASAPGTYGYIKRWVNTIGDLVNDSFGFARIPNGECDGLSVQPLVHLGSDIFEALKSALVWGDFQPTMRLLEKSRDICFMGPHIWRIDYHECS